MPEGMESAVTVEQMADLIESAASSMGLKDRGLLSPAAEQQLQFQMRLKLARYGLVPPANLGVLCFQLTELAEPNSGLRWHMLLDAVLGTGYYAVLAWLLWRGVLHRFGILSGRISTEKRRLGSAPAPVLGD